MTKLMLTTAAAALLTTAAASAQNMNTTGTMVNTDAVIYTQDASQLDDMSIEELNALQLKRLNNVTVPAPVSVTTSTATRTQPATTRYTRSTTMTKPMEAMGGPAYNTADDASKAYLKDRTIAEVAMMKPEFSTLTALLKQADLAGALMGEGPYTVFAPTNAAFEKLDADTRMKLMSGDYNDKLASILKAHVVSGTYMSGELAEGFTDLDTIGQSTLQVERTAAGDVKLGKSAVTSADIKVSNGVIHVIDEVIIPEKPDYSPYSLMNK